MIICYGLFRRGQRGILYRILGLPYIGGNGDGFLNRGFFGCKRIGILEKGWSFFFYRRLLNQAFFFESSCANAAREIA
ncbi:hypothetical protein P872_03725 [Rhodonellum psychrophilum GCM71 = DSM 17998]|uniref:Uncharacterized protein n=1 Tax=Rhodonellum psychrophilum GCM71 = DSM 17998 TaxID=1123057 RepID=U5BYX7_9BACT|nr:hypothetical protein P872_03725 [Rhodonellum psychrophilum GCM71 = DSM 17998]